jgi:hypothetical protein
LGARSIRDPTLAGRMAGVLPVHPLDPPPRLRFNARRLAADIVHANESTAVGIRRRAVRVRLESVVTIVGVAEEGVGKDVAILPEIIRDLSHPVAALVLEDVSTSDASD